MRQFGGWGYALGLGDGNPIKLDYDDHCTTINVINSLSNEKKKEIISWNVKFCSHFGKYLVPQRLNIELSFLRIHTENLKHKFMKNILCMNVHSTIINNSQEVERTYMSINKM